MKNIPIHALDGLPGIRLKDNDTFSFRCHAGVSCFNQCCRNLNLFLYPYDVIRLKHHLNISADQFIDRHVDIILKEDNFFPEVLLTMADNHEKTCPFLTETGCSVYADRPDTCRTFPIEQGLIYSAKGNRAKSISFFRPPVFCQGRYEKRTWTTATWAMDQDAGFYNKMTVRWAKMKYRFQLDPWGGEGLKGPQAKMAFMATYNMDRFREFVFKSSFLNRYRVKPNILKKAKTDDIKLLELGFEWLEYFLWSIKSKVVQLK